jgi:hypothetical protein
MDIKNKSTNKSFGIVFFFVFLIISFYPFQSLGDLKTWGFVVALIFLILGFSNSIILTPLNILWFKLGIILSKIFSPLIMCIIFFLVVTPIGLLMRLLNKDLLKLKFNSNSSYWIEKTEPKSKMKNQF